MPMKGVNGNVSPKGHVPPLVPGAAASSWSLGTSYSNFGGKEDGLVCMRSRACVTGRPVAQFELGVITRVFQ